MQILKKLLIFLVVVLLLVVVVGFFLPARAHIRRSVDIKAPPERVHAFVDDLTRWPRWRPSDWTTAGDPTLKYTYEGSEAGVGSISKWTSARMRPGMLKIISSDPRRIEYGLTFDDGGTWHSGSFEFEPKAGLTTVRWGSHVDFGVDLFSRYLLFFFREEMESIFDEGLAKLKIAVETAPAPVPQPPARQ